MPFLSPDEHGGAPYNCDAEGPGSRNCGADLEQRRRMHCGWMPKEDWLGEKAELSDLMGCSEQLSLLPVCPGWLVRQPAVEEAKMAGFALEKGALRETFPSLEHAIVDAAFICVGSWKAYEAFKMDQMKRNQGG